ncbi:MAG TPA: 30S ribosomal protein S2 [Candidatus Saccharimonadales bacterium]|nr:30S ribosomal protein S2 [Candidatus Saccharimonadales bacterium]
MAMPTLLELADSGAHFGHHRSLIYPKARKFIYTVQQNVAIINLEETQKSLEQAQNVLHKYLNENKVVLFVGTKRAVRETIKEVAESVNSPYIVERWFGGTLTNFQTIISSIKRMKDLEDYLNSDKAAKLSKKDRLKNQAKLDHYHRFLGGLINLKQMPDLIVLASASDDKIAIAEANQLNIPIIAITDTDMNPDKIAYPIPANDDAAKAMNLILRALVEKPADKEKTKNQKLKTEVAEEAATEAKPVKKAAKKAEAASKTKSSDELKKGDKK